MQLYRELPMGDLAHIVVADTRQYRTDQPYNDQGPANGPDMTTPAATLPGIAQEQWIVDRMGASKSTWNILAQQVLMASHDLVPGAEKGYSTDQWDAYRASRQRVLAGIHANGTPNPVVLTGDIHQHYAADLLLDFDDPASPIVGSELCGTSVTSGGDGSRRPRGPDREPLDQVQRQAPRLRPRDAHRERTAGGLPPARGGDDAERPGLDRRELHAHQRPPGPAGLATPASWSGSVEPDHDAGDAVEHGRDTGPDRARRPLVGEGGGIVRVRHAESLAAERRAGPVGRGHVHRGLGQFGPDDQELLVEVVGRHERQGVDELVAGGDDQVGLRGRSSSVMREMNWSGCVAVTVLRLTSSCSAHVVTAPAIVLVAASSPAVSSTTR